MRRPMALIGFSYLAGLILATYFIQRFQLAAAIAFFILFLISLLLKTARKRLTLPIAFLSISVALFMYSMYNSFKIAPVTALDGQDAVISGKICELPYKSYNRYYYTIQTDKIEIDGAPQNIKLRLSMSKALDIDVYDRITGNVHLFLPSDEGTFSSKNYYASKGIYMYSYLYEYEDYTTEVVEQKPIYYYFLKMRFYLIEALRTLLPEEQAALASGILLGEKYLLGQDVKSDFRDIGVSHILAVSGLHTSFIGYFLMWIFMSLKLSKKWSARLSCIGILCFMALTGFVPSAVRSGIMMIIYLLGLSFKAEADSLNSLGISSFIISICNPFAAGDIGFLLSFFATLGIILLAKKLELLIFDALKSFKYVTTFINKILSPASVTISATLFTLPITVLCFKQISLISIIANLLLVTPSMFIMVTALLAALFFYIPLLNFLSYLFALICGILINFVTFIAAFLAKISFASISVSQPFIKFCLASAFLLIAVALILEKGTKLVRLSLILSVIILFTGTLSYQTYMKDLTQLAILDVGDGCCAVLTKNNHAALLSCGGDKIKSSTMRNYLQSKNVKKLDFLILSDYNDESSYYAQTAINEFSPSYIVLPEDDSIDDKISRAIADNPNTCFYNSNALISFWDNINLIAIKDGDEGYLHLKINDTSTLIYPSCKNSYTIPEEYINCGFFVFSKIPNNQYGVNCGYSIISASLENAKEAVYDAIRSNKVPIATAGDGNIVIDFPSSNNVCIRRVL